MFLKLIKSLKEGISGLKHLNKYANLAPIIPKYASLTLNSLKISTLCPKSKPRMHELTQWLSLP